MAGCAGQGWRRDAAPQRPATSAASRELWRCTDGIARGSIGADPLAVQLAAALSSVDAQAVTAGILTRLRADQLLAARSREMP